MMMCPGLHYPPPLAHEPDSQVPPVNLWNINAAWIAVFWIAFKPLQDRI